jgi:hypothetical protein
MENFCMQNNLRFVGIRLAVHAELFFSALKTRFSALELSAENLVLSAEKKQLIWNL